MRISALIFLSFLVNISFGQEVWTLEKCIEYALEHNISIKQSELNVQSSRQDQISRRGSVLPSLNGSASNNYNFGRTVDPFTNEFTTETIQSANFGLSSSWTLFNGLQNWHGMRKAELDLIASRFDLDAIKNDISINVALAYLNILMAKEAVSIAEEQLLLTNEQVKRIEQLVVAGAEAKGSLFDIKAQQATDEQSLVNAENQLIMANLNMGILLELDDPAAFKAASADFKMPSGRLLQASPERIFKNAVEAQPMLKAASVRILSAERQVKMARGGLLPRLSANASMGTGFSNGRLRLANTNFLGFDTIYTNGGDYITNPIYEPIYEPTPFEEQFRDNFSQTFGLVLTVPIFNGWSNRTSINRAKIGLLSAQYNYEQNENNLRQSIYQAHADANAALKRYNAALRSVEALREAFNYTSERYRLGVVNSYDFSDAKTRLTRAESDLLQAKYDYIFKLRILEFYNSSSLTY